MTSFNADGLVEHETAAVVRAQERVEATTLRVIGFILVVNVLVITLMSQGGAGGDYAGRLIGGAIMAGLAYGLIAKGFEYAVFRPLRSIRFGRCIGRLQAQMEQFLAPSLSRYWTMPRPAVIGLDTARRLLFVQGVDADYRALILNPHQILDVKLERKKMVVTNTTHHASPWLGIAPDLVRFGFLAAGKSTSRSRAEEDISLEIVYAISASDPPSRLTFYFGPYRRDADDYVLAIRRICR